MPLFYLRENFGSVHAFMQNLPAQARRSAIAKTMVALAATQNPGNASTSAIAEAISLETTACNQLSQTAFGR